MLKTGFVILAVVTLTAGLFFVAVQRSVADTLLFNRGLPTTNLNNAAGTDQSNGKRSGNRIFPEGLRHVKILADLNEPAGGRLVIV